MKYKNVFGCSNPQVLSLGCYEEEETRLNKKEKFYLP